VRLDARSASWKDVEEHVAGNGLAVLPFGALEQHGPHLSLDTDTVLASGVAGAVADALDALLLPALAIGDSWGFHTFPGTVSLAHDTVAAIGYDVCESLAGTGFRALVVLNGHHGNRAPLAVAARRSQAELGFPVLVLDYPNLEEIARRYCESEPASPFYHADEVETSLMLHLAPERVRMELAAPEYPEVPASYGAQPMNLRGITDSGVFGDPTTATAEKGRLILEAIVEACRPLLDAFTRALPPR
jgi:creatinine amidohydrolase